MMTLGVELDLFVYIYFLSLWRRRKAIFYTFSAIIPVHYTLMNVDEFPEALRLVCGSSQSLCTMQALMTSCKLVWSFLVLSAV
jgi:hypothetical protein